jgi:hypothetical protein
MKSLRLLIVFVFTALSSLLGVTGLAAAAPSAKVECGFFEFVAPDAVSAGSIEFGANAGLGLTGDLYVIAAGSSVSANLTELGGAPTCLELTLSAGIVTEIDYAPSGVVRGPVIVYGDAENDPDNSVYVTAGRVITPAAIVAAEPGLWAILGNAVATGEDARLVLEINTEFGFPQNFTASTRLHGEVDLSDSDVGVGLGLLPDAVIDSHSRKLLEQAAELGTKATVEVVSEGSIDVTNGALNVTTELDVEFARPAASQRPSAEPTPPPTQDPGVMPPTDTVAPLTPATDSPMALLSLVFLAVLLVFVVVPPWRARPRRSQAHT